MDEIKYSGRDLENESRPTVNFLDFLGIIVKRRKFIVVNFVTITVVAIVISLLLPKWYKATASILPPKDQILLNQLGLSSPNIKGLNLGLKLGGIGQNTSAYNYLAILKSRTLMESVVKKFDLVSYYEIKDSSLEKAIKQLRDNVSFEEQEDNYLTIEVYDRDPHRAADIANYFVDALNAVSIRIGTQEARCNREFIEGRVGKIKDDLRTAEENLQRFQEHKGIMITPDQSNSAISTIAELYGMKAKKEIELAILERTVSQSNEVMQERKIEISELEKKLAKIPQSSIESFRLYRDVAIQQKLLEFLVPVFEQAKLEEQKNVPILLVLDKAVPPERKDKPKRLIFVSLAMGGALLLNIIGVFIFEFLNKTGLSAQIRRVLSRAHVPFTRD